MLARRLLMVAGGGGSFTPSTPSTDGEPFAIGPADSFGWSDFSSQISTAVYYNGKTYRGYLKSNGNLAIRHWDHSTDTAGDETDMGSLEVDLHDVPSLVVRDSDKRILIFYALHNGSSIFYRASTNAEDVSSMGSQNTLDAQIGGTSYTYAQACQLTGEANDPLYLFFRSNQGGTGFSNALWAYSTSTDDGATWAAQTQLWQISSRGSYLLAFRTSTTRIDVIATDGAHGSQTGISVYHLYYEGGDWHGTDGTVLSSPPFNASDATLVYDGSANDGAQVASVALGIDGKPVCAFRVWETYSGPEDMRYWWARWNGSSWDSTEVVANGVGEVWGGIALDPADPRRMWIGHLVSGEVEMHLYQTADDGDSFTSEQLTTGSTAYNVSPVAVVDADASLKVMWGRGVWADGDAVPYGWGD